MDKGLLDGYSWLVRGRQRRAILIVMDKPMTPSEVLAKAKRINPKLSLNNTSDVLRLFETKDIAKCLNPEEKVGRLYSLSAKGKKLREQMLK